MTRRWIFHRSGGSVCLDLANTVSWRRSHQPIERLPAYGDLVEWARQSGILAAPAARALEREGQRRPATAARILARARALREAQEHRLKVIQGTASEIEGAAGSFGNIGG